MANKQILATLFGALFLGPGLVVAQAQDMNELFKLSRFNGKKDVTKTIVIDKAGVYDFENVLHIWKGKNWNCLAGKENGPQILRIEASNVTVKNFAYIGDGKTHGSKGLGDPVHVASCGDGQGNLCKEKAPSKVVLDGVYGHACEDMITIGTPGTRDVTIQNSTLIPVPKKSAWDKIIQINFGTEIKVIDNKFLGSVRCVRYKPNTSGTVEGNSFKSCENAVFLSAKDADIAPMKDGPSTVLLRNNSFGGGAVKCKDGGKIGSTGTQVCK
jgi:hypothetical protein